jgi:hypothetical protein
MHHSPGWRMRQPVQRLVEFSAGRADQVDVADMFRGTATCVVIGAVVILMPASALPRGFGYHVAFAVFLLGLRFGHRAIGMLFAGTVAVAVAHLAGRGACTPSSDAMSCGFAAAAPILIFGCFVVAAILVVAALTAMRTYVRDEPGFSIRALPAGSAEGQSATGARSGR